MIGAVATGPGTGSCGAVWGGDAAVTLDAGGLAGDAALDGGAVGLAATWMFGGAGAGGFVGWVVCALVAGTDGDGAGALAPRAAASLPSVAAC